MQPNGESESSYLTEIQNLYDSGYKFIVTPGYKFETAIYKAQSQYEDAKFVLIDGEPNDGNDNYVVADNTVAVYFAEEQSGFIAGVASAVAITRLVILDLLAEWKYHQLRSLTMDSNKV